jgi:class 3 adenylate cyclase/tetratricopeptide (TPR) repeat protein
MRCSKCGAENPDRAKFCVECAAPFAQRCASCGAENPPNAKFCLECAKPLGSAGSALPSARESANSPIHVSASADGPLEGERKTVTALFADIKGSTELEQDLDPEEARAIIDPALKLMIDAAHHYDGYVQSTGDGVFALFGAPVAHEDHPQRALYAAIRMQEEIRRYGDRLRREGRAPLAIRVGINTGEVVVRSIRTGGDHTEYAPIGHTINLASRMQTLATPGSIAISEQTRKLVEGYFQLKALGPARLKGITEQVNVYEVTGLGPLRTRLQRSASRGYTKFVGREREMEALRHAAELAQQGHGQVVAAVAEPGVGKSRLFHEFKAKNQSGWMVLEAVSFSHGKATAYLPLVDLLRSYFGIEDDDDVRKRREKVAGRIALLDRAHEDALPYVFGLLGLTEGEDPLAGMDVQTRRRRSLDHLKRILLRESLNQPLMVIFEDLHWIDEETQAFLNVLADSIGTAKILLLVNYRPEYSHQWNSKTYYTQLRLDPLGRESAGEMLDALVGVNAPTDSQLAALKGLIIEKTDGTPLFMEEIVKSLIEEGALVRNGAVKLTRPLDGLKIPPTVQGILHARIDRLAGAQKDLLQTLAVIGMEFPLALAREVVKKPDDELNQLLNNLQLAEFIYEQPAAGDIEYKFKHALTHDVAYNSMLSGRRKVLHERTGQTIEALYRERLDDHYTELAHHYLSSNNAAKAIQYLRLAAEQAAGRGAYAQALANVDPALKLLEALPDESERLRAELGVRLLEGRIAPARYGMASLERVQICERVCELSERLGDTTAQFFGLLNLGFAYSNRFEASRAQAIAKRLMELAEQNPTREMLPAAHLLLGYSARFCGDLLQASSHFRNSMEGFGPHSRGEAGFALVNLWANVPVMLALVQQVLGRPDEAVRLSDESLRRDRQLRHSFTLTVGFYNEGLLRYYRREPRVTRELAEAAMALAEEHGFRDFVTWGRALRGWAMTELGQTEQGVAELEAAASSGPNFLFISKSAMLAQVYLRIGRLDQALAMADEELARIERSGAHFEEPELYRLKGEAILGRDSSATSEAKECFRRAIEIARSQSAKWWELRATTSLACLLRQQGKRDEALAMLAEIYNWFTEGFDTADLKDAKSLLDELSSARSLGT